MKKIGSPASERYKLVLSDGTHCMEGMLATQMNAIVNDNLLQQNCIIMLKAYILQDVQGRRLIICLDMDVANG